MPLTAPSELRSAYVGPATKKGRNEASCRILVPGRPEIEIASSLPRSTPCIYVLMHHRNGGRPGLSTRKHEFSLSFLTSLRLVRLCYVLLLSDLRDSNFSHAPAASGLSASFSLSSNFVAVNEGSGWTWERQCHCHDARGRAWDPVSARDATRTRGIKIKTLVQQNVRVDSGRYT